MAAEGAFGSRKSKSQGAVASEEMHSRTMQNLRKAAKQHNSNQALGGRTRERLTHHQVQPYSRTISLGASSSKKVRSKPSQSTSKSRQPGGFGKPEERLKSRRRRRTMQTVNRMPTAPRRRRSTVLTAHRTLIASPSLDPLASSSATQVSIKAVPDLSADVVTDEVADAGAIDRAISPEEVSGGDVTGIDEVKSDPVRGALIDLTARIADGSTTVLFLCALLTFGVLMVGGAVLCAGMADDGSHAHTGHEDQSPYRNSHQPWHPQERYSIETQPRRSHSMASNEPPRPSTHMLNSTVISPPLPAPSPPTMDTMVPDSLPTPQPKLKQKEKSAKREDNPKDVKAAEHLCPSLVVPSGMEFVFAVREDLDATRQELNFNIVDLKGAPLSRVVVSEKGDVNAAGCGIFLQTLTRMPLAMVDMKAVHEKQNKSPLICRPNGEVFGQLKYDESGKYLLKNKAGKGLLIFHGDFSEKAVNVMNTVGKLVCATERCVVDFDSSPHYQVRIAPYVDAGLVICGLLCIDKLEPKNERSP